MKQFLSLLKFSIGSCAIPPEIIEEEWRKLFKETKRQTVSGLIMSGIEKLPTEQQPPQKLMFKWKLLTTALEQFSIIQQKKATELTQKFQELGFKSCVLKGVGIAQLYPNPLRRQGGDIDLWVDGNRKDVTKKLSSEYKIGKIFWHHTEVEIFEDIEVEIHFYPSWLYNPIYNRRLQHFFTSKKADAMKSREIGFNYPSIEFEAVHSLAHTFHHLLEEGIGFRHIVDYYYILQNLPKEKHNEILSEIRNFGLEKFLGAMMYVLIEALELDKQYILCEPNPKEGKFLLNEIYNAGNFGKQRKGGELKRNSFKRYWVMVRHYPNHVLWMIPWKMWHLVWRGCQKFV